MPVIPAFTGFASTPDTAGAFLGGVRIAQQEREAEADRQLKREQLAQAAAEASARIQFGREQLAARQAENQMELEARQKLVQQKALQDAQEANIEAAYKNTEFGLAERRLKAEEQRLQMQVGEAARGLARELAIQKFIDAGGTPEEAMRKFGVGQAGFPSVLARPPSASAERNFAFRQLKAEEEDVMRKYPGMAAVAISPEDQAVLQDIQKRRRGLTPPPTMTGTNAQTSEVIRRDKSGRRVVFDANTKKALRYAD